MVNSSEGRAPQWGQSISMLAVLNADWAGAVAVFVDRVAAAEAVEPEGGVEPVRLVPVAIRWAKHQPEAGVALKPP